MTANRWVAASSSRRARRSAERTASVGYWRCGVTNTARTGVSPSRALERVEPETLSVDGERQAARAGADEGVPGPAGSERLHRDGVPRGCQRLGHEDQRHLAAAGHEDALRAGGDRPGVAQHP